MARKRYLLACAIILIAALFGIRLIFNNAMLVKASPVLVNSAEDEKEITAVLEKAYRLLSGAAGNFDVSHFNEVYANTSDYQLTTEDITQITAVYGEGALPGAGYLTVMQARYTAWGQGDTLIKEARENPVKENGIYPEPDIYAIQKQHPGITIAEANTGPYDPDPKYKYESIEIQGDKAIARVDSGAVLADYILTVIEGQWYIVNYKPVLYRW